jgi:hypothetical protein
MSPFLMLLAAIIHCTHIALGLPALEGIEQAILAPGPSVSYMRLRRS